MANTQPTFNEVDKFDERNGFSRIIWGERSKVLETELIEMQKIQMNMVRDLIASTMQDGFIQAPVIGYSGGVLTLSAPIQGIVDSRVFIIPEAMTVSAASGGIVYLASWEQVLSSVDTIKREGNMSGGTTLTNTMQDTRIPVETSRRAQVAYQLVTSNADNTKKYLPIATIAGGAAIGIWTRSNPLLHDDSKANLNGAAFTGPNTHSRNLVTQPQLKDYSEKLTANAATTGAIALDIANGNVFDNTLTGATTFTFSNPAVSGQACSFTLLLRQGATAQTVSWPASVVWNGGTAPDLTNINKTIVLTFMTVNGGTRWYGFLAGNNFVT